MADPDTNGTTTSKNLYPEVPQPDTLPHSEETSESRDEEPKGSPTTTVEINHDTGYKNKEKEGKDFPEYDEKEDEGEQKDTENLLLEEKQTVVDIGPDGEGEDMPNVLLPDKKREGIQSLNVSEKVVEKSSKLPKYLFPIKRIKESWSNSTSIFQFLRDVVCIIFQTVGWFTRFGGIPFLSLVMLIIGSIYVDDCRIQPNIPVFLIVSGVIGTIQHLTVIWTKHVPKTSEGQLNMYWIINGVFHLFLFIWFILGAKWVYGASDVDTKNPEKKEYCHSTLYYFTYWIFNVLFILLVIFLIMLFLICAITTAIIAASIKAITHVITTGK